MNYIEDCRGALRLEYYSEGISWNRLCLYMSPVSNRRNVLFCRLVMIMVHILFTPELHEKGQD